jgi:uncharacterized protein
LSGTTARAWAGPLYLDASALTKLLVPERESNDLNAALADADDVIISDLALTEIASALGRRVREGTVTLAQARRLNGRAFRLLDSCRHVELTPPIHRYAERLLLSASSWLRTLDALHLALAVDAKAATVVTFDARLTGAARAQGLFVEPAES